MIEGKGLGGKRINRLKVSLTNKEENDLIKLATACGMKKSELAYKILTDHLYDSLYINQLQREYCTQSAYKVVMVNKQFILSGREDL